jgi:hypothetical protein
MKYFQNLLLLGIFLTTILFGQSIELPQKFMNKDEIKNIPIYIYNVTNLQSITLKIEYDESIVLAEEIIENPTGILDGGYTFTTNFSEPGIIQLAIGSNSANIFSGSGMVAKITFKSIGNLGEFSYLTILDAQINSDWQISAVDGSIELILDELTITGQDDSGIGANHVITLGMCDGCTDEWKFGEDEDDYPDPQSGEYTNINFYQLDWFGEEDENGNVCNQIKFSTNFRSQHSFRELTQWGISGSTSSGIDPDIQVNLSWDSEKLISNLDYIKMFIYVGDTKYNMQEMNNISVLQSDLNLVINEPNIWVKMGVCADTGESTIYYQDFDGDGLGSGISRDYCFGFVPEEGWVTNSDDGDDYCYSNVYDCSDPPVCDGTAVEDCNGECGGSATEDECSVCNGDNSFCTDCNGDLGGPNGIPFDGDEAYLDGCDECVGGNTLDDACIYDCSGEPGGSKIIDECGECGGSGIPDGDCDCNGNKFDDCGECGGTAVYDESQEPYEYDLNGDGSFDACDCNGGIPDGDCDCNGNKFDDFGSCCTLDEKDDCGECNGNGTEDEKCNCAGDVLDCAGECGGSAIKDNCGVCNNYEAHPEYPYGNCDCIGDTNGTATNDNCGTCDDNSSNDCTLDCLNIQDGLNIIDNCGTCDVNPDNNCIQDCAGLWGGPDNIPDTGDEAAHDECGICTGGATGVESCVADCIGTLGGTFWLSECGCVEADNSGDECDDCAENPNGTAELDLCGNCIDNETDSNITCDPDCDGIYGGNHPPTFTCQNGNIACNFDACFNLANEDFLLPQKFDISRIYPNPFNPSATIDFEVSEPTMVHLNIYNLQGQKVEVLKDAFTLPGHYSVIWNGTNHPSGLYFVILHSSKSIVKQKMMLIK